MCAVRSAVRSDSESVPATNPFPKCARSSAADGSRRTARRGVRLTDPPVLSSNLTGGGGGGTGGGRPRDAPSTSCPSWNIGTEPSRLWIPAPNDASTFKALLLPPPPCPLPGCVYGGAIPARATMSKDHAGRLITCSRDGSLGSGGLAHQAGLRRARSPQRQTSLDGSLRCGGKSQGSGGRTRRTCLPHCSPVGVLPISRAEACRLAVPGVVRKGNELVPTGGCPPIPSPKAWTCERSARTSKWVAAREVQRSVLPPGGKRRESKLAAPASSAVLGAH